MKEVNILLTLKVDDDCDTDALTDCIRCMADDFDYDFIKEDTGSDASMIGVRELQGRVYPF